MKHFLTCVCTLMGLSIGVHGQQSLFRIQYDVSETITYHNNLGEELNSLDTIAFMPEISSSRFSETFFNDGTIRTEIQPIQAKSYLESWLDSLQQIVVSDSMSTVKTTKTSYELSNNSKTAPNIREIIPYYLGTNTWQLPLDQSLVHELQTAGFELVENSPDKLIYQNGTWRHTFNKPLALESLEHFSPEGTTDHRTNTYYCPNTEFPLMDIQLKEEWFPSNMGSSCAWVRISSTYYNIVRTYSEPVFEDELAYQNEGLLANVSQIPGSHVIQINLPEAIHIPVTAEIRDSYGLPVRVGLELHPNLNQVMLTNVPTGIYTIYFNHSQLTPTKFLYTP